MARSRALRDDADLRWPLRTLQRERGPLPRIQEDGRQLSGRSVSHPSGGDEGRGGVLCALFWQAAVRLHGRRGVDGRALLSRPQRLAQRRRGQKDGWTRRRRRALPGEQHAAELGHRPGGGHAPDIIKMAGYMNVLPSSTNPTRPYTVNTMAEHMDMLMVCHHLNPSVPEDVAFAESRIRPETMAAEDVLHDLGVLSMYSSDSQAMGRIGETFTRLFQTADKMLQFKGKLSEDSPDHDNFRVLRYLAKLTINPAITHGISHVVGSIAPGKLADIVLWPVGTFGAKPKMVIKGGMVNWGIMGDPNGSIPTVEPTFYRPMFGSFGLCIAQTCVTFISKAAHDLEIPSKLGLQRKIEVVRNCRTITKQQMVRNDRLPKIEVNPDNYQVTIDGALATVPPANKLSLAQLHFLV